MVYGLGMLLAWIDVKYSFLTAALDTLRHDGGGRRSCARRWTCRISIGLYGGI